MPPVASASFWGWRQRNLTYGVFATLKALQSLRRVPYPKPLYRASGLLNKERG